MTSHTLTEQAGIEYEALTPKERELIDALVDRTIAADSNEEAAQIAVEGLEAIQRRVITPTRKPKKGAPNRSVKLVSDVDGVMHTFHATKGHRWSRVPQERG